LEVVVLLGLACTTGCAFYLQNQSPRQSSTLLTRHETIPVTVGIQYVPEQGTAPCGDTFQKFIAYLRQEKVFANVLYELRPTDNPDLVLETQFNCRVDYHHAKNLGAAIVEGTFLVPILFPLRNIDWTVEGSVNVKRDRGAETLKQFQAISHFHANYAYFAVLRPEKFRNAFRAADEYAYRHLVSLFLEHGSIFERKASATMSPASNN